MTAVRGSEARQRQIQYRSERILESALELFCEKGIQETSVEEIAGKAGVGSAPIYRYYSTKAELAIQSGVAYWEKIAGTYLNVADRKGYTDLTGKKQLECIMDGLKQIFEHEQAFLKYLQEFDVFVRKYGLTVERLKEYEDCIMSLKPRVIDALDKGKKDGTLSFEWSSEEVCYSLAHSVFGLMKKLSRNGSLLALNEQNGLALQVEIAVDLLVRGLTYKN